MSPRSTTRRCASCWAQRAHGRLHDEVDLLQGAGALFDDARFRDGDLTPVFFGSALNNFGVETFLDALLRLAPAPGPRASNSGLIDPDREHFAGFVFKIQANMDPLHRDCMAFLRVCSGRFTKDMQVNHPRLGRAIRMTRPHRLFARERETIDEAFPGDVVGLTNPGVFEIGDTLCTGPAFQFDAVPRFAPECFARLTNQQAAKHKQFVKGMAQLEAEGVIQIFYATGHARREPIVAAVGELQFDVVQARLRSEYGVDTAIERLSFSSARWVVAGPVALNTITWTAQTTLATDRDNLPVALFGSDWDRSYCERVNKQIVLAVNPPSPNAQ